MKKIFVFIIILTCAINVKAQTKIIGIGDTVKLTTSFNLWKSPADISVLRRLTKGTSVVILSFDNSYFNVSIVGDTSNGYLYYTAIDMVYNPTKYPAKHFDDEITKNIESFGSPDKTTNYSTNEYNSKTLTWYCVMGRYRQLTFVQKNGNWIKDSEYDSECIK